MQNQWNWLPPSLNRSSLLVRKMMASVFHMSLLLCRFVFVTILIFVFITNFGIPSYNKFIDGNTIFTERKVRIDKQKPPAITIFPWRSDMFNGLKNETFVKIQDFCNTSKPYEKVVECIEKNTFTKEDIIKKTWTDELHQIDI